MDCYTITVLTLSLLAGLSKAVMDTLVHHYDKSIFNGLNLLWWNPKHSWKSKYKDYTPTLGPRFLGSTTVFVFATDAWHLFQMIFLMSFTLSIFMIPDFDVNLLLVASVMFRVVFEISYLGFSYSLKDKTLKLLDELLQTLKIK